MQSGQRSCASGKREISEHVDPRESICGMPKRTRQINHADKQKEHQSQQRCRQAYELPQSKTGSCCQQRASDKIRPGPVRPRHPGWDHILDKLRAAKMLGREYSEWNGDEDRAEGNQLVPAAGRAYLFSQYKNSGNKIEKPGKRHPEIG